MTAKVSIHTVSWVLLLTFHNALSSQYSGVISNFYKKAAQENRPLILVVDSSLKPDSLAAEPLDYPLKKGSWDVISKKELPDLDKIGTLPSLLLQQLGLQQSQDSVQASNSQQSDLLPAKKKLRSQNRNKNRAIHDTKDKNVRDRPNKNRPKKDRREKDRHGSHGLRIYIERSKGSVRSRAQDDEKLALRSAIVNNILRFKDDNCVIKTEDDCSFKEDTCEVKVECEETQKSEDCEFSDTCAEEDKRISTRGELLMPIYGRKRFK